MIGILGAMEQEVGLLRDRIAGATSVDARSRRFVVGELAGRDVAVAISGFGKVAAASTATKLIERFAPSHVIFTGVAGGIGPEVRRGDVVVADALVQHDFDASPIFPRFVIPTLGVAHITADAGLVAAAVDAAEATGRTVHRGLVASGDRFVDDGNDVARLRTELPGILAVEMEGAAVAQVCAEHELPFVVIRAISDTADDEAAGDFMAFVETVSSPLLAEIVERLLRS